MGQTKRLGGTGREQGRPLVDRDNSVQRMLRRKVRDLRNPDIVIREIQRECSVAGQRGAAAATDADDNLGTRCPSGS